MRVRDTTQRTARGNQPTNQPTGKPTNRPADRPNNQSTRPPTTLPCPQRMLRVARTSYAKLAGPLRTRHLCAQVARMSQAKLAGSARGRDLQAQSCEDGSSGRGHLRSQHFQIQKFQGCFRRYGQEQLSRGIWAPRVARMSQATRARQSQIWLPRNTNW